MVVERYPAEGAKQLGRIARNRRKTGMIAAGEQDNVALWKKIRNVDESMLKVLPSAKKPKVKRDHLSFSQGIQMATSMAPLTMCGLGWQSTHPIFLTHYGPMSRSYATSTQGTDYVGVSEATGL